MTEPRNLWEALLQTESGRHAHALNDAAYHFWSTSMPEADIARHKRALYDAQHFFEELAYRELAEKVPWAKEMIDKIVDRELKKKAEPNA